METFLPSEIARLVLGYLKEENCQETSKVFMRECMHLQEYIAMLQQGREFSTEVLGLSLKMILNEYGNMKLSRRTQATPALTNLWNKYDLMGVQLREAVTPFVTPATLPSNVQLVNSMQSFSRRQGARNRYGCARTEGLVVVRSEVAITTANNNAPPSTPRSAGRASTLVPLTHQTGSVPSDGLGFRAPTSSVAARRSQTPSQREDDLESLVSVCSGMSSICDQVDSDVVIDHTETNDPGNDHLSQTLTDVDPVLHQETATPAKIISPTSRSPLSSTQLTSSTPGHFPKTSQQPAGTPSTVNSPGATQKKSKPPRRIQPKMIGDGAVLSPIRALTSTAVTPCHTTSVTSHEQMSKLSHSGSIMSYSSVTSCNYGTILSSGSIPATTCNSGTDAMSRREGVATCSWNPVTLDPLNPEALSTCTSAVDSIILNPAISVNGETTPFQLFPLGSGDMVSAAVSSNLPSFVSYPVDASNSVPTTSFNSIPVYTVPFDSCNSGPVTSIATTGFSFVPVTCDMVPVSSCDSVPVTSNQAPLTVASVPVILFTLDQDQSRETVTPSVTDTLGTPSKRRSCSSCTGNGDGDAIEPQVPRMPVRSRCHVTEEFNSLRDRRKKAQPCKRRSAAEQVFAPGSTSANTSSVLHCSGGASTFDSNPAKGDLPDLDINEMLERLIGNQAIAEKIAENINRMTSQNTSRSDSVANPDDPDPSNCPGTAPNTLSKASNHNPNIAVESASNSLPIELNHQGQNHLGGLNIEGERNDGGPSRENVTLSLDKGLVNEMSRASNNVTLAAAVDTRSYEEGSAVSKECRSERVNLHQSGQLHEETVSDLSCTSLLSLSNLDQMTDDAIRFVFDQLCSDPNLDSICSMTYHHTERTEVDTTISSATANQTTAVHQSHVELLHCTPFTDATSTHEIPLAADSDLQSSVQNGIEPPIPLASASVGFDTRRRYIQVCFPGPCGQPDRIDIVEVIGSGVEISNSQPSPDNRTTVADGCQKPLPVSSDQETASDNPMLLSSEDVSYYVHSSTDVASTLTDASVSGWPTIIDLTGCESTFDNRAITTTAIEYYGDCVVASANIPQDASQSEAGQNVDSSLNAQLQMLTIAERDLDHLRTSVVPSSHEDIQFSSDLSALEPSEAKLASTTSSSAMECGPVLCQKRETSSSELAGSGQPLLKSKKNRHRPGTAMKTSAAELKLDERTGKYLLTNDRIEKRKRLGFGVPGKIPANTSSQSVAAVGTNPISTSDVGQLQLACSTADGSMQVFTTPDFNNDCIVISEIPCLFQNQTAHPEEDPNIGGKDIRGRNLSKKQFRVLNRGRGPSTPSSISTGSFTGGGISGPSTPSRGAVESLTSVGIACLPNPSGRTVDGTIIGITSPTAVYRSLVGSVGCAETLAAKDLITSDVIAGLPTISGSALGFSSLSTSSRSAGPHAPTESAKVPSTPTDSASAPSSFIRSLIAPSSATSGTSPRNPHSATDERSDPKETTTSIHKSRNAKQTKSMVVYFDQECSNPSLHSAAVPVNSASSNTLNDVVANEKPHKSSSHKSKKKAKHISDSLLSAAISVNGTPSILSTDALADEKLRKASRKSKKKAKHVSDSDKNKSSHTDEKGKTRSKHKKSDESGKTKKLNPASHATKNIDCVKKEGESKRKEPSNTKRLINSSDDDDMPIAYLLKSDVYKDARCKDSMANTGPTTETLCPQLETVSAKKRLKEDKKSDSSMIASNNSSTQNSCKGLGGKIKTTKEKESKEFSTIPLNTDRLSVTSNHLPSVLSRTVQSSGERESCHAMIGALSVASGNNVESEIVPGNSSTLYSEKNLVNSGQSAKTKWNEFKTPESRNSLPGKMSTWNTNVNSSISMLPSASMATECCRSPEHIFSGLRTSKTSAKTPGIALVKPRITPITSIPKTWTTSLSGSGRSLDHILPDLETAKTFVETPGVAPKKSQITSSQKTPITSTPKSWTASPKTLSFHPPKNSDSVAHNGKSSTKSTSGKTQKHSFSSQLISSCSVGNLSTRKHQQPKPSKTKKHDQAMVKQQPAPSLLSRANKIREASTYTMSCSTLLSMPSSFEGLLQLAEANKWMVSCNDEPIQSDTEAEHLEKNAFPLNHSGPSVPVAAASVPLDSADGGYDDVVIASALLSLSSSVPGDSGFAIVPQNVLSTSGNTSTETASASIENAELSKEITTSSATGVEICHDLSLHDKSVHDNSKTSLIGKTSLMNNDLAIINPQRQKGSPVLSQTETACDDDSGAIDLSVAARDFDLDGCCTKHLRTSSFSSPEIGLVLNIDEGSIKTPSSPSTSTSACPSVPESYIDENPGSCTSEPGRKRRRSSSVDSDRQAKQMLRKKLKGLDINAFLKQLHSSKNLN